MLAFTSFNGAVLARIRDQLGGDLAAHIHLSQTCRKTRRLYEDDAVWQTVCFRAGFGRPRRRTITGQSLRQLTWRALAYMLVRHASRCEIRSCKAANACFGACQAGPFRLATPVLIAPAAKQYRRMSRTSIRAPPPPLRAIAMHPLYYYLHFAESPVGSPHMPSPDTLAILLTHLPTFPESKSSQYGPLCVHPNASCAFATFPPMQSISFEDANGDPFLTVRNPDGCTILDVNRALGDL